MEFYSLGILDLVGQGGVEPLMNRRSMSRGGVAVVRPVVDVRDR